MEIERKFLINKLPEELSTFEYAEIEQCYIDLGEDGEPEKRIRRLTKNGDTLYFYTEKGEGDLCREEEEYEIPAYSYGNLRELTVSEVIRKTRYYIPLGDSLTAELDVYGGSLEGLITAEVEFEALEDSERFSVPDWFGEEITRDKKYKNKNLALR